MMQTINLLITLADFNEDKLIPSVTESAKVEKSIRDAQEFDLRPLMGDAFYSDLVKNLTDDKYQTLMNGEEYVNDNSETIIFPGLRMALKYWAYARHIESLPFNVTSHGIVNKLQDNSQPVSSKTIAAQVEAARSGAVEYWSMAVKYLKVKYATYTLWNGQKATPRGSFRMRVGGKNN